MHHRTIGQRARRGQVHRPGEIVSFDKPFNGTTKVNLVKPGDVLPAVSHRPTESQSHQPSQHAIDRAGCVAKDHRRAEGNFASVLRANLVELAFPSLRNFDGEFVVHFRRASDDAAGLVHRPIERMLVDCGRAGIEPDARRFDAGRNRPPEHASRFDPRIHHQGAIAGVITAVDATAGEIDQRQRSVKFCDPRTKRAAVPIDGPPQTGERLRPTREHDDVVTRLKPSREHLAQESGAAGQNNFRFCGRHGTSLPLVACGEPSLAVRPLIQPRDRAAANRSTERIAATPYSAAPARSFPTGRAPVGFRLVSVSPKSLRASSATTSRRLTTSGCWSAMSVVSLMSDSRS